MRVNRAAIVYDALLTSSEVASMWRVDSRTVNRWAKAGKLGAIRTPGKRMRYRKDEVMALFAAEEAARNEAGGAL